MRRLSSSICCALPLWLLSVACCVACSADAVEVPEPTLRDPGTFVASGLETGGYRLLRTNWVLQADPVRAYLFMDEYLPGAETLERARSLAQDFELPLGARSILLESAFIRTDWHIVWYRSLNDEERQ